MRILAVIRQTRCIKEALDSIRLMLTAYNIDALWLRDGRDHGERYANGTERLQLARQMCLAGPYDALLVIDDDLVLPLDTFDRIARLDKPVLMGLTVRRTKPHLWSAVIAVDNPNGIDGYITLDQRPELVKEYRNQIIQVYGCGHNPTLIRRDVLEQIDFRREPGEHGADRYFAYDCRQAGISMWCDAGLQVGHHDGIEVHYPALGEINGH